MKYPSLIGVSGPMAGKPFPVSAAGLMLGTDFTVCNVVFPVGSPGISRIHCELKFHSDSQMFVLYDLGSAYGTFNASGFRIRQGQPYALSSGEEFYLATPTTRFRVSL